MLSRKGITKRHEQQEETRETAFISARRIRILSKTQPANQKCTNHHHNQPSGSTNGCSTNKQHNHHQKQSGNRRFRKNYYFCTSNFPNKKASKAARVVELVDTQDLKSCGLTAVRVRLPSRVQKERRNKAKAMIFRSVFFQTIRKFRTYGQKKILPCEEDFWSERRDISSAMTR